MNAHGKVALVTGGAHRVGRAIVLALAEAGAHVVVNYRQSAVQAAETVARAQACGVDAVALACDVADAAAVTLMAEAVHARFGGVDILVNSAGVFRPTPFPTAEPAAWTEVVDTSIHGTFFVSNALAPGMLSRGGGVIINILDMTIDQPWRNFSAHAVGKAGMQALTRQLALELAPAIRVNAVAPGIVLPPDGYTQAKIEAAAQRTLLKRWGTPEDVGRAVLFLVESDFVTGEIIRVDGGERFARSG